MTYIIAEPCIDIKDRSCVDVCPVDCIHEFDRMLIIDPEECIDCGACEPECPVEAIFPEDALPDKWEPFVKINYAYSEGAGGARTRSSTRTRPSTTSRILRSTRHEPAERDDLVTSGSEATLRVFARVRDQRRRIVMPQEAWSDKRERQYEHIKDSLEGAGARRRTRRRRSPRGP